VKKQLLPERTRSRQLMHGGKKWLSMQGIAHG
jgi:hypothetical protein